MDIKICSELEQIKKENQDRYDSILKILNFIYKTIKEDYFDRNINSYDMQNAIHCAGKSISYSSYIEDANKFRTTKNLLFKEFVDDGIEKIFLNMISNPDKRYLDYFLEKVSIPIDLIEGNVLDIKSLYIYNIYTMMVAYEKNSDDFDTFKKVVDDISYLVISKNPQDDKDNLNTYKERINKNDINKKTLIRNVLNSSFYKSNEKLQKFLKDLLTKFKYPYKDEYNQQLRRMFDILTNLENDLRKFSRLGYAINKDVVDRVVDDITLYLHDDLLTGVVPFYDKVILFGDRFNKLKEEMRKVDPSLREDVLSYFKHLDIYMFKVDEEKDLFCDIIKVIFDSDTYHELHAKLQNLQKASKAYTEGNREEANELLNLYFTDTKQFKQKFNGLIIEFPTSNINQTKKPDTIGMRMKKLYQDNDLYPLSEDSLSIVSSKDKELSYFIDRVSVNMRDYLNSKLNPKTEDEDEVKPDSNPVKKKTRFSFFN